MRATQAGTVIEARFDGVGGGRTSRQSPTCRFTVRVYRDGVAINPAAQA